MSAILNFNIALLPVSSLSPKLGRISTIMPLDITDTFDTAMLPVELTLIVAATREMGIGRSSTLPWTGLKREMAYFARVTKKVGTKPSNDSAANVGLSLLLMCSQY
jgi:hypothetical protein